MIKPYSLQIDLKNETVKSNVKMVSQDTSNKLEIVLVDDYKIVDLTGHAISINFKDSKGEVYNQPCQISDNKIICTIATGVLNAGGKVDAELRIEKGSEVCRSCLFNFTVRKNLDHSGSIVPTTQLPDYKRDYSNLKLEFDTKLTKVYNHIDKKTNELQDQITSNKKRVDSIVAQSGNDNTELVDSRDGESNLRTRLERDFSNLDGQLKTLKADIVQEKFTTKTFTEPINHLEFCPGGAVEVLEIQGKTEVIDGKIVSSKIRNIKTLTYNLYPNNNIYNIGGNKRIESDKIIVKPNTKTFVVFDRESSKASFGLRIRFKDIDGQIINSRVSGLTYYNGYSAHYHSAPNGHNEISFITPSNCTSLQVIHAIEAGNTLNSIENCMLIQSDVAPKEFIKYDEHIEVISKDGIEVHCVNNIPETIKKVTIEEKGQMVSRLAVERRNKKINLDGSRNWKFLKTANNKSAFYIEDETFKNNNDTSKSHTISSILLSIDYDGGYSDMSKEGIYLNNGSSRYLLLTIDNTKASNPSELKTWLSNNNVPVLYNTIEEYYDVEVLKDFNNVLPSFPKGYLQIEYDGVPPQTTVKFAINIAAVRESMMNGIKSNAEQINVLWSTIFVLTEKIKELEGGV